MTKKQEHFTRACKELGIEIHLDYEITLPSGHKFVCMIHIPKIGETNGMIIINFSDEIRNIDDELANAHYGYSAIGEYEPEDAYNKNDYIEMFNDWGWSGPKNEKPKWME